MSDAENAKRLLLQKRLRFLMRAYIACWLVLYFGVKKDTAILDAYRRIAQIDALSGLSPLAFVWLFATLIFAVVAGTYLLLTRPPKPEASWRDIDPDELSD